MRKLPASVENDYVLSMSYLGLTNLSTMRCFVSICFMYKVLNNLVDTTAINLIAFDVPHYPTRVIPMFHVFFIFVVLFLPITYIIKNKMTKL